MRKVTLPDPNSLFSKLKESHIKLLLAYRQRKPAIASTHRQAPRPKSPFDYDKRFFLSLK